MASKSPAKRGSVVMTTTTAGSPATPTATLTPGISTISTQSQPHASPQPAHSQQQQSSPTPPVQPQSGLARVKQRRAERDAAEAAAKQEVLDAISLKSYNEMLKNLLSKEIQVREQGEAKVKEITEQFELFKSTELESLKAKHKAELAELEQQLYAKFKAEWDGKIEALVSERVAQVRATDAIKYRDLNDIQRKLHIEFEDKYAQRLQKLERDKWELQQQCQNAMTKADSLVIDQKAVSTALAEKDSLVQALEYRCQSLEKLKANLRSFRSMVKFMSCRVFVNTIRLKKQLHSVYDSLRILYEKLNVNFDYDRTSEIILPQHELEVWLTKVYHLLNRNKQVQQDRFNMIFAGTKEQFGIHPNTALVMNSTHPTNGPKTVLHPPSSMIRDELLNPPRANPSPLPSPSQQQQSPQPQTPVSPSTTTHRGRTPSRVRFPSSMDSTATHRPKDSTSSGLSLGGSGSDLGYSLNFREMLYAMAEVEIVLRGCLIECLNKAAEWKASSEDFFSRNQELVQELTEQREAHLKAETDIKVLQSNIVALEKSLATLQDERKVIREIEAAAPINPAGPSGASNPSNHHARTRAFSKDVAKRLIQPALQSTEQNGVDRDYIPAKGGLTLRTGASLSVNTTKSGRGSSPKKHTSVEMLELQTQAIIDAHHRQTRLSNLDVTNSQQLLDLSALDLKELSAHQKRSNDLADRTQSGPRGFFQHHNAVLKCAILQKERIEALEKVEADLRHKVKYYKDQLKSQKEASEVQYWEVGAKMDGEVDAATKAEAEEKQATNDHTDSQRPSARASQRSSYEAASQESHQHHQQPSSYPSSQSAYDQQQPPPSSSVRRPGPSNRPTAPLIRPHQLDLDEDFPGGLSNGRSIRTNIPFSPPVYPVSPYEPKRPHSSASTTAGGGGGSGGSQAQSRNQTPSALSSHLYSSVRGPALTMTIPPPGSGTQRAQTARSTSGGAYSAGRSHSATGIRPSPGAELLLSSLAATQPITTSSQSYAGTNVYTPSGHLHTTPSTPHSSTRAPKRVYGHHAASASLGDERPRTSDATSSRNPRTINPLLLQVGLASASTVAAVLTAQQTKLHPAHAVTGDVRYDVISPYCAQPLPWEATLDRRAKLRDWTPKERETEAPQLTELERRRERERKPPVPRQNRSVSRERQRSAERKRELEAEKEEEETNPPTTQQLALTQGDSPTRPKSSVDVEPPTITSPHSPSHQVILTYADAGERLDDDDHRRRRTYDEPHSTTFPPVAAFSPSNRSSRKTPIEGPPTNLNDGRTQVDAPVSEEQQQPQQPPSQHRLQPYPSSYASSGSRPPSSHFSSGRSTAAQPATSVQPSPVPFNDDFDEDGFDQSQSQRPSQFSQPPAAHEQEESYEGENYDDQEISEDDDIRQSDMRQ